jgi:hypothetical protein
VPRLLAGAEAGRAPRACLSDPTGVAYEYDLFEHTTRYIHIWFSPSFGGRWQIGYPNVVAYIDGYQSLWELHNATGWREICAGFHLRNELITLTVNQTLSECTNCSAGTYATGGAYACTPCPVGTYSSVTGARNFSTCQSCPAYSTTVVLIYDQITSGTNLDALKTPNAVDYYFASITGADNINDCLCNAGYSGPHGGPCTACEQSKPTFGMTQCPKLCR